MATTGVNKNPTEKDLRTFGFGLPVFFAVLGVVVGRRSGSVTAAEAVWAAGGALSLAYLALPSLRRPVFVGWSYLTHPIGWVVSHLIMGAVFYLVLTPIGLLLRLFGQDPLQRRFDRTASSYWIRREGERPMTSYFRQY